MVSLSDLRRIEVSSDALSDADSVLTLRSDKLLGIRIDDISPEELIDAVAAAIRGRRKMLIVNANVHLINLSAKRPWLVDLFEAADIAFCDGAGVQFALWMKTGRRPSRHTPPQWIHELGRRAAAEDASIFWLGGRPDVVEAAARNLQNETGARSSGLHHGFFDLDRDSAECQNVVAAINKARPEILLLNLGMPLQERWLAENWGRLDVCVAITGGALVDHVAGLVKRPPLWVANLGIEWLVRLMIEPTRLWRRYLLGLPLFGFRLLASGLRLRSAR